MEAVLNESTRQLPLNRAHEKRHARFGDFGQWRVPLYYTTILEEHSAVRNRAGLFDVSHMGKFLIEGSQAETFLDKLLPRNISKLPNGKAAYSFFLNSDGGILDDVIAYKISQKKFYLIVNAGAVDQDFEWMKRHLDSQTQVTNLTQSHGLLALQGPLSSKILQSFYSDIPVASLSGYGFLETPHGLIARTGYSGEDGFEVMVPLSKLENLWESLLSFSEVNPAGFGARDTLRLEAGMLLCGQDMTSDNTPLECGLEWCIDFSKKDFVGKSALCTQKRKGLQQKLIGFTLLDRGIPRHGCSIRVRGRKVGCVTSGSFAPTLKKNIGLGYIESACASIGQEIEIVVRDKAICAAIVRIPFYKK